MDDIPDALDAMPQGATRVIAKPYLLFLASAPDSPTAKTAFGLRDWCPQDCVGEWGLPGLAISTGLPWRDPRAAVAAGARSLVIGVAAAGGQLQPEWTAALLEALHAGLDIVSGMHTRLAEVPSLASAAEQLGRRLVDVRVPPANIPVGTGRRRTGRRLLTLGTDCALGKKYTALSLTRAFAARGLDVDFRATGQTGILIAGGGIPIDAVVSDFVAGAAEMLSPDAPPGHWDVIEGQGSLFHPAYAGVTLGLLHGSQPDVFVMCHDPTRRFCDSAEQFRLPGLTEAIALALALGRRVNPRVRCAGVSLNTGALTADQAEAALAAAEAETGLPAADPLRGGVRFEDLVSACLRPD
ncbi:MAG: DUF1611 domain-containing protein [Thermohalobaculum sp.]